MFSLNVNNYKIKIDAEGQNTAEMGKGDQFLSSEINFGLDGLVWIYYFMFIFIGKLRILDFGLLIPFKFIHWIDDSVFTGHFSEFGTKISLIV